MNPVTTMLATRSTATVAATTPALRRRLVTRDHDQHGARLHLRSRRGAHLRDTTRGRSQELVLHLHRLERGERRIGIDVVAFLYVHGLQQTRHRSTQLDPARAESDGAATRAERALVDHARADITAADVETERLVRHYR